MGINSINLFGAYQQNGISPISPISGQSTYGQNVNQSPLINFNQNGMQGDTFVKTQQNPNMAETPSGKMVSKEDKDKMLNRQDEVRRHEQAHQAAGGALAGAPSYEYNEYGYIQNGHVNISVPGVNKNNPEYSKSQAEIVKKAALAPSGFSELSSADLSVASQAQSVINESEKIISEKNTQESQDKKQDGNNNKKPVSTNPFA